MELTIETFDPEKIVLDKFEKKQVPGPQTQKADYFNFQFKYDTGTTKTPIRLELPMMTLVGGIRSREVGEGENIKQVHSADLRFELKDPEKQETMSEADYKVFCEQLAKEREKYPKTLELLMKINQRLRKLIAEKKSECQYLRLFKPEEIECSQMKTIVYFGKEYQGDYSYTEEAPPRLYLDVFNMTGQLIQGKPSNYKTKFVSPTENGEDEIPWTYLKNVDLLCYPLIKIGRIFVGGVGVKTKMQLENCIIIDIQDSKSKGRQTATLDRLKKNPDLVSHVQSQLSKYAELQKELQNIASKDPALLAGLGVDPKLLATALPSKQKNSNEEEDEAEAEHANMQKFLLGQSNGIKTPPKLAPENIPKVAPTPIYSKFSNSGTRLNLGQNLN